MSLLSKIMLEVDEEGFLFTKMSLKEANCNVCQANIKLSNAGSTNLKVHLAKYPAYQKQFGVIKNAEKLKKNLRSKGKRSLLSEEQESYQHLTERLCIRRLPEYAIFIVEAETFKPILSSGDRENIKESEHYREWVMPRVYAAVKKKSFLV